MSIEVEVLGEVYTILKQYIPQKDRQEAADNVMSVVVDMLNDIDLQEFGGTDSNLKKALKEYSSDEDEDNEDNYDYED
jgi:DNA-binding transcriptional regulator GbsR (MarR family)